LKQFILNPPGTLHKHNFQFVFRLSSISSHSRFYPFSFIMAVGNGTAIHSSLAPGHFLFTSESVGEGHPGTGNIA
jgi:hypothetical protein